MNDCPLCLDHNTQEYAQDKLRSYLSCNQCQLIFVPRNQLITSEQEKLRYNAHQNHEDDPYYQKYLQQIVDQILPFLKVGESGLDFGCGRTDLMGQLFKAQNFVVDSFDLYFLQEKNIWENKYNYIILSEVIEHLRDPLPEMTKLRQLLKPHGQFFVKTKLHPEDKSLFNNWFYKRDSTHVQFFNLSSLKDLANQLGLTGPELIGEDLFRFRSLIENS